MISEKCSEISKMRVQNNAVEPDIWKACAAEVVEAKEAETLYKIALASGDKYAIERNKKAYAEEIADVFICGFDASDLLGIDLEQVILDKIKKNELRAHKCGDKL